MTQAQIDSLKEHIAQLETQIAKALSAADHRRAENLHRQKLKLEEDLGALESEDDYEDDEPALARRRRPLSQEPRRPQGPRNEMWQNIKDTIGAPYRFVPLNDVVVKAEDPNRRLDVPVEKGGSARLTVEWAIETPLLVGKEVGKNAVVPMTLGDNGKWVIPGATLRGMLRSALEIVAFGSLRQINDQFLFGLRDFTHPLYREKSPVSRDEDVRAGWLKKVGDVYRITPCADDGNDWGYVEIESLPGRPDRLDWAKKDRNGKKTVKAQCTTFVSCGPRERPGSKGGRSIYRPEGGGRPGELVVSGKTPTPSDPDKAKRFEYVFFRDSNPQPASITPEAWRRFEVINCRQARNGFEPEGAWKELKDEVENGRGVPVFYVGPLANQDADFAFGLTRLFKIPHKKSVGDKVPEALRPPRTKDAPELDFVESLFGLVEECRSGGPNETIARKSRVSFGFARPVDASKFSLWPSPTQNLGTIMMAPRASYASYYLIGAEKDWSSQSSRLAGRKRYVPRYQTSDLTNAPNETWHRLKDPVDRYIAGDRNGARPPDSVLSKLQFLLPVDDAAFASEIRLFNVSKVELGAILWVLTFGGDPHGRYRHMIGRAKPMGAGQTRVHKITLKWKGNDGADTPEETWQEQSGATPTHFQQCLDDFEKYMNDHTNNRWKNSETLNSYLAIHGPGTWAPLAGQLNAAMGGAPPAASSDQATLRQRVLDRANSEKPLSYTFLARPKEADPYTGTANDFQTIRNATKSSTDGPPDPSIPQRLLRSE